MGKTEELYFGRAAARVHIALPALSCQIQSLEKELGVRLLECSTRKVELSRAGAIYYDRCVRILGDVDLSAEVVRSVAGSCNEETNGSGVFYETRFTLGGCHVPFPAGRMDGASVFGQ